MCFFLSLSFERSIGFHQWNRIWKHELAAKSIIIFIVAVRTQSIQVATTIIQSDRMVRCRENSAQAYPFEMNTTVILMVSQIVYTRKMISMHVDFKLIL